MSNGTPQTKVPEHSSGTPSVLVLGDVQVDVVIVPLPGNQAPTQQREPRSSGAAPSEPAGEGKPPDPNDAAGAGASGASEDAGAAGTEVVSDPGGEGGQQAPGAASDFDTETHQNWKDAPQHLVFRRPGGAWLVNKVVAAALGFPVKTAGTERAEGYLQRLDAPCPISLATLRPFPEKVTSKPKPDDPRTYRISTDALIGWMRLTPDGNWLAEYKEGMLRDLEALSASRPSPELLVLHDHNQGFRDLPSAESIAPFLDGHRFGDPKKHGRCVILLHSDGPLATGGLWRFLYGNDAYRDRLVVVVNAEDLRNYGVTLVEDLSVERTVADFMQNVQNSNSPLASLARCRCVVVKSPLGLIIHSRKLGNDRASVNASFLPYAVGGPYSDPDKYGKMVGYSIILVSAIAKGIHWAITTTNGGPSDFQPRLDTGIRFGAHLGLVLCEQHLRNGFLKLASGALPDTVDPHSEPYTRLFEQAASLLSPQKRQATGDPGDGSRGRGGDGKAPGRSEPEAGGWDKDFRIACVDFDPQTLSGIKGWSRVRVLPGRNNWLSVEDAAIAVVKHGLEEVVNLATKVSDPPSGVSEPDWVLPVRLPFPYARIGKLKLVDRDEIDSFSHIEKLLQKYLSDTNWKRPLSIAVFGPPGSGKSFTVKQIIKNAMGDDSPDPLEFNLSQFQSLTELSNAFHQVQDRGLAAAAAAADPPLVFFDEFDTSFGAESLGWLKYFLAPMQDGTFRDAHSTFRVGRAIFVFAGGICDTFHEFYGKQRGSKGFHDAKGPDFVSRLRGHLNIQGINPPINSDGEVGEVGDLLMFRRAILLRAFLEESCPAIIDEQTKVANIHSGVICAFLRTRKYEHGVRSMEAIVQMSAVSLSRKQFQRSSVPAATQLAMHVDAEEFQGHLQVAELEVDVH